MDQIIKEISETVGIICRIHIILEYCILVILINFSAIELADVALHPYTDFATIVDISKLFSGRQETVEADVHGPADLHAGTQV